jgi:site-specific recombinase XerD
MTPEILENKSEKLLKQILKELKQLRKKFDAFNKNNNKISKNNTVDLLLSKSKEIKSSKIKKAKKLPRGAIDNFLFQKMLLYVEEYENSDTNNFYQIRLKLTLYLLYITGARVSELLDLRIETVFELLKSTGGLQFHSSKTNTTRQVYFHDTECKILAEYIQLLNFKTGFLISQKNYPQKKLNNFAWIKYVNRFLKAFSTKFNLLSMNLKSHSFRIGLVTSLAGKSLNGAQRYIGHSAIETTQNYYNRSTTISREEQLKLRETSVGY